MFNSKGEIVEEKKSILEKNLNSSGLRNKIHPSAGTEFTEVAPNSGAFIPNSKPLTVSRGALNRENSEEKPNPFGPAGVMPSVQEVKI